MADIELVIKVPDKDYEKLKDGHIPFSILDVMQNGTPLPKGHGRLIDADAVLEDPIGNTYKDIEIAETIIEADKEREEPRQILKNCRNCGYPHKLAGKCYSCDDYSQWIPIEADKEREE